MAPKPFAERRVADRRSRHEYPEIERRKSAERRVTPVRDQREGPSLVTWAIIVLVGMLLVDSFVWQGQYRHALMASINADAAAVRGWSNNAWRSAAP